MKATLNQEDIKILKSIFATKDDLVSMEKRQDKKYVTKDDLNNLITKEQFSKELDRKFEKQTEEIMEFFKKYFEDIQLEEKLDNHEKRIKALEDVTPALAF